MCVCVCVRARVCVCVCVKDLQGESCKQSWQSHYKFRFSIFAASSVILLSYVHEDTGRLSDFTEIRESHFTAQSLRVLFQEISLEKIFNSLKGINIFGRI